MADETKTAGTPGTEGGDAHVHTATTGTPEPDGRNAGSGEPEPDYKRLYLEDKENREATNRMRQDLEEIKARLGQPPVAHEPDELDEPDDVDWRMVEEQLGTEAAKVLRRTAKRAEDLEVATIQAFQIREIPDKKDQEEVLRHWRRNHRRVDIRGAAAEVKARKQEAEIAQLREENARANEALKKKPPADTIKRVPLEVPASATNAQEMTESDFDAEIAALRAQGMHKALMAKQMQVKKGEIKLRRE